MEPGLKAELASTDAIHQTRYFLLQVMMPGLIETFFHTQPEVEGNSLKNNILKKYFMSVIGYVL